MITFKKFVSFLIVLSFLLVLNGTNYGDQKQPDSLKSTKVNINTAGVEQLVKLPRIGEKIAERIIEFRKKNGKFKRIQELMKVKGIGEKLFKRLEKLITV